MKCHSQPYSNSKGDGNNQHAKNFENENCRTSSHLSQTIRSRSNGCTTKLPEKYMIKGTIIKMSCVLNYVWFFFWTEVLPWTWQTFKHSSKKFPFFFPSVILLQIKRFQFFIHKLNCFKFPYGCNAFTLHNKYKQRAARSLYFFLSLTTLAFCTIKYHSMKLSRFNASTIILK